MNKKHEINKYRIRPIAQFTGHSISVALMIHHQYRIYTAHKKFMSTFKDSQRQRYTGVIPTFIRNLYHLFF